jgi:hypothetical protein
MPSYTFRNEHTGKMQEMLFSMSEVVPIGTVIEVNGDPWRRCVDLPQVSAAVTNVSQGYPYVSRSLPRNLEGAETNKLGQPIIRSRWHEREVKARHNLERD